MKPSRQDNPGQGLFDPAYLARSLAIAFPDGHTLPFHDHPWPQFVYAQRGVMQVTTHSVSWLVPTTRAIWVPAGEAHSIHMRGAVAMRTLYLSPSVSGWPTGCRALEVSPLLRELVLHLVTLDHLHAGCDGHARLVALLADLVAASESVPLTLPLPRDPRARKVAERILAQPGQPDTLAELATNSGASQRTLQRLFCAETGLGLEAWRLRARMQQAVVALGEGLSVTEAAFAAGYSSASAFSGAFKRCFGVTPSRYRRQSD
jgi:AraC-like DNA-binding protein